MEGFPILTAIILTPFVGALVAMLTPRRRPEYVRIVGFVATAATLGFAGALLYSFHTHAAGYQFVENTSWMGTLGVRYHLGVDGISLFMIVLTALLFPLGLLASADIEERLKAFTVWMLILESALLGVFLALDLVLFFVFFEIVLVPMYFIIGQWGHGRRVYAATKFFLYTMAGSAFLLVGLLSVAFLHQAATGRLTFDLPTLMQWTSAPGHLSSVTSKALFLAFFAAFAVKVPLFPLHTWLPDAHTEAPTAGSVILAGVLLKMGTYGFLRFSLQLFPKAAVDLAPLLLVLATIGIVYGAVVAAMQPDLKRIIAYSSVAHLGFVMLGLAALTPEAVSGAVLQMVNHGISTGALFLMVGFLYERTHTRDLSAYGGVAKVAPAIAATFLVVTLSSIGLPGTNGFVGEFLVLIGTFASRTIGGAPLAVAGATGVILGAVYMLWMYQRVFFGPPHKAAEHGIPDLTVREWFTLAPILLAIVAIGFAPQPLLSVVKEPVDAFVQRVSRPPPVRKAEVER